MGNNHELIVTGGAGGIGAAVARLFLKSSGSPTENRILLVDRDAAGLARMAAELGDAAAVFQTDLAEPGCGDAVIGAAVQAMGGVDAIVSNAGISNTQPLTLLAVEDYHRVFNLNTRAAWLLAKAAYPLFKRNGGGAIVATASTAASHPVPNCAYAPSKAALVMLMRQLANEWGPDGIRCNAVSPGTTLTPMTEAMYADAGRRAQREARMPLRRISLPEDIAGAVMFLLSPAASQITGIDLELVPGRGAIYLKPRQSALLPIGNTG